MQRIIAFNIIYLSILFIAHVSGSSPKNISDENSKSSYLVSTSISMEIFADIEEEQEEPDTEFAAFLNYILQKEFTFQSVGYPGYKSANLALSLIFIFQTDLPPPNTLS